MSKALFVQLSSNKLAGLNAKHQGSGWQFSFDKKHDITILLFLDLADTSSEQEQIPPITTSCVVKRRTITIIIQFMIINH